METRPTSTKKPVASLSLDLDNKWSYLKTHGNPAWQSFPSYLDIFVPRVLQFFQERDLTITVFVVGQDAALPGNREVLRAIAAAGHEIGNHSLRHEPWLHLYSEQEIETELARAEEYIERVTERKPRGFRAPGFSLSLATLRALGRLGYVYDASTLPTFLGPLARAYYFMSSKLTKEQKQQRKALFGTLSDGLRRIKPYRWPMDAGGMIEIPVTTMPLFKLPIHVSYILYLSDSAPALALSYFNWALRMCRLTATQPSILLHPLDFLGYDAVPDLSFFPGMKMTSERKLEVVSGVIQLLAEQFNVVTLEQHAQEASRESKLPVIEPKFRYAD